MLKRKIQSVDSIVVDVVKCLLIENRLDYILG